MFKQSDTTLSGAASSDRGNGNRAGEAGSSVGGTGSNLGSNDIGVAGSSVGGTGSNIGSNDVGGAGSSVGRAGGNGSSASDTGSAVGGTGSSVGGTGSGVGGLGSSVGEAALPGVDPNSAGAHRTEASQSMAPNVSSMSDADKAALLAGM